VSDSHAGAFHRIDEREVHQGSIWRVVVARFSSPEGEEFVRDIVRSPGAVGVLPVVFDVEGNPTVVLVRQYRPALEMELLEIPAGMRDVPGEPLELTARRELAEETGYEAENLELLTMVYPSAGLTDSTHHLFLATGLTEVGQRTHGPEERHMVVVHLPLVEAVRMASAGEITDAKSVIALLLAERRLAAADGAGP
jgi:8-oxo-dGDP phosphatase